MLKHAYTALYEGDEFFFIVTSAFMQKKIYTQRKNNYHSWFLWLVNIWMLKSYFLLELK